MDKSNLIDEDTIINKEYYKQMLDTLNCTICSCLITEPKMCSMCETPYCKECIDSWFSSKQSCPMRCTEVKIVEINRSLKKIFEGLKLKCKYGCEATLLSFKDHTTLCEDSRKTVNCWNCSKQCKASELKYKQQDEIIKLKEENESLKKQLEQIKSNTNNDINSSLLLSSVNNFNPFRQFPGLSQSTLTYLLDDGLKTLMESWINTNLNYRLLYKATTSNFKASSFHSFCDNKGPTIVIMKTTFDKVIGGFTPLNWVSPQSSGIFFRDSTGKSFLFSYTLKKKYPLKSNNELAICCNKCYGPIFGNYDLLTVDDSDKNVCGNFDIGTCYEFDQSANAFYGGTPYKLKELEVYSVSRNVNQNSEQSSLSSVNTPFRRSGN